MEPLKIQLGTTYNSLTIIKEAPPKTIEGKRPKRQFVCECSCGRMIIVRLDALRNNKKSSCGCLLPVKIELVGNPVKKHGLCYASVYKRWKNIRNRCYSVTSTSYKRYGARGIDMSAEWYSDFSIFHKWCMENGYQEGLQLDRIDNDKGYFPENCRWATPETNNNNKSNNKKYLYQGLMLTLPQISRKHGGFGFPTLYRRINENKLSLEEALSIPLGKKCKKERNAGLKLSDQEAIEIYVAKNKPRKELCQKYGVHISTVDAIRSGSRYSHIHI